MNGKDSKDGGLFGAMLAAMLLGAGDSAAKHSHYERLGAVSMRKFAELVAEGWNGEQTCQAAGAIAIAGKLRELLPLVIHQARKHGSAASLQVMHAAHALLLDARLWNDAAKNAGVDLGASLPNDDELQTLLELARKTGPALGGITDAERAELEALRAQRERDVEEISTLREHAETLDRTLGQMTGDLDAERMARSESDESYARVLARASTLEADLIAARREAEQERERAAAPVKSPLGTVYFMLDDASMRAVMEAATELAQARKAFPAFNSMHEGWAVIREEVDELWDEIKGKHPERRARALKEAKQVAAMGLRFLVDITASDRAANAGMPGAMLCPDCNYSYSGEHGECTSPKCPMRPAGEQPFGTLDASVEG